MKADERFPPPAPASIARKSRGNMRGGQQMERERDGEDTR